MNNRVPKLKLIQGGKKSTKNKLNLGLILVCGIVILSMLVLIYGV